MERLASMGRSVANYVTPRRFHFWALMFWLLPGAFLSFILRNSIGWVNFMSWYAIVLAHAVGNGAERAGEAAQDNDSSVSDTQ